MNSSKRSIKENQIIGAAEKVFSTVGFANAKMETIAKEIGISKGTVYFYFNSKENLYMAVTYRAFQTLLDMYYDSMEANKHADGKKIVLAILNTYLDFTEKHHYYFELLMNYMTIIRANAEQNSRGDRLSEAMRNSLYFRKIQDIHNLPLTIVVKELEKGQKDGSIKNQRNPIMIYLTAWAVVVGYTSLNVSNSKSGRATIFKVPVRDWKSYIRHVLNGILLDEGQNDSKKVIKREKLPSNQNIG
jgi:AcrR family transcriptional regulator